MSLRVGALDVALAVAAHIPGGGSESRMRVVAERRDIAADAIEVPVLARLRPGLVGDGLLYDIAARVL